MAEESLAVLAGLKYAQVIEDGMVFLGRERRTAVTSNEDGPSREFDLSPFEGGTDSILRYLASQGLVEQWDRDPDYYRVTHKGWHYAEQLAAEERARLERLEQMRQQQAQQERQQRFENKMSVLNLLIPLITFLGGLFLEHHVGIIAFLKKLFH